MAKDTGRKIAIGAAIAAVIGYIAGILTAPKSGKETRADIKNTAGKFAREAEKKLKALNSELGELIDKATVLVKKSSGTAKEKLDKALEAAKQSRAKVREVISAIKSGEADHPELEQAIKDATKAKNHLAKYIKS